MELRFFDFKPYLIIQVFFNLIQGYRIKNLAVYQDIRDSTLHLI
jgi:hypothetical protein